MFDKRINIFTGHFGSGKTEIAVNYVLKMAAVYNKTAIVDFDIVNPFFRTTDVKADLENNNIRVVTPLYANTNVDVPALPSEINTVFENKEYRVVFDVGGDDIGARVLSRYRNEILEDDYEMFFVVNTRRPMTDTKEKIEHMINEIQDSSRLKITKLVNNTNLLDDTTAEDIIEGHTIIEQVSKKLNIPFAFISGYDKPVDAAAKKLCLESLKLEKLIKLPWYSKAE
jgi:hypothetical protein